MALFGIEKRSMSVLLDTEEDGYIIDYDDDDEDGKKVRN